jgi:hypothetical protein
MPGMSWSLLSRLIDTVCHLLKKPSCSPVNNWVSLPKTHRQICINLSGSCSVPLIYVPFFSFFFWVALGFELRALGFELRACLAGALVLEPLLQPFYALVIFLSRLSRGPGSGSSYLCLSSVCDYTSVLPCPASRMYTPGWLKPCHSLSLPSQ